MIATLPLARPRHLPSRWLTAGLAGLAIYLLARPLLALAHELAVLGTATLFNQVHHERAGWALVQGIPADPVYTGAAATLLSNVDAAGLALAGPLGTLLHAGWPGLFLDPGLVEDGAFVSALILPGSTLVARGMSFLAADVLVLAVGWAIWFWATSGRLTVGRVSLALAAAAQQLHVVVYHHLDNRVTPRDLESLGVPFALSSLQRGAPQDRPRVTAWLASVPPPVVEVVVNLLLAALAISLSLGLVLALRWSWRAIARWRDARPAQDNAERPGRGTGAARHLLWIPALALAASPLGAVMDADSRVLGITDQTVVVVPAAELPPAPAPVISPPPAVEAPMPQPTRVEIAGGDFHYQYIVNGDPTTIRGMGYNVRYAQLSDEDRRLLYDRDFALMRSIGVNTVVGWEAREFDELTLDRAAAQGLGVVPPLELHPEVDYTDEAARAEIVSHALDWVQRYKHHPAVRMWALGNEILHKLVYPSWMSVQAEPWREQRAQAFARLLVDLADRVHEADPLHPVVYTDAEDAYVRYVREAVLAAGQARPWFVYGINVYTPRLRSMIDSWPTVGFDTPLFVSEFSPGGLSPQDRPAGLRDMWEVVQSFDDRLLGGAIYAWSTEGPEEVDRVFGLVDGQGEPVDGALSAVARMYGGAPGTASMVARAADEAGATDAEDPLQSVVRTAFLAIQPEIDEPDAESDEMPEPAVNTGQMQVARVVDDGAEAGNDNEADDAWWVTWRSKDTRQTQLALLVERGDDGQTRVSYLHRPRQ